MSKHIHCQKRAAALAARPRRRRRTTAAARGMRWQLIHDWEVHGGAYERST